VLVVQIPGRRTALKERTPTTVHLVKRMVNGIENQFFFYIARGLYRVRFSARGRLTDFALRASRTFSPKTFNSLSHFFGKCRLVLLETRVLGRPEYAPARPVRRPNAKVGGKNMRLFVHKDANGTLTVGKDGKVLHFSDREALQIYTWMGHHCHAPAKPLVNRG